MLLQCMRLLMKVVLPRTNNHDLMWVYDDDTEEKERKKEKEI